MKLTTLKQVEDQEYVIWLKAYNDRNSHAERWFSDSGFSTDTIKVNFLFSENGYNVYESYSDPASVDYLYIIQSL